MNTSQAPTDQNGTKLNSLPPIDEVNKPTPQPLKPGYMSPKIVVALTPGITQIHQAAKPLPPTTAAPGRPIFIGKRLIYQAVSPNISPANSKWGNCQLNEANLGAEVKRLRKNKGWTQAELASKAGIGRSTVCHAENGYAGMRTLMILAHTFGLELKIS